MPASDLDVDLQYLYEQVLAGFSDESPPEHSTPVAQNTAGPSDLDSLYSSYIDDSTDPSSYRLPRTQSYTIASQPASAQRSPSVQSQGQAARRRLPPIPGGSSASPTSSTHGMPEPRPYSVRSIDSKPTNIPSPTYNGTNGYHNGGGPPNDYFSANPRLSQQSHLSSTLRPGSSRSNASPSTLHTTQYPPDEPEPPYGWADPSSLSRVDSARPPLPPKILSQPAKAPHMPEQLHCAGTATQSS
jgi:hypothetical protein